MTTLMDVLTGGREREPGIVEVLEARIAKMERQLAVFKKALIEVKAMGPEKFDRVVAMANSGEDPDAPRVQLHPGPHGPDCDCDDDGPVN